MPQLTRWLHHNVPIFPVRFKEVLPLKLRNRVSFNNTREQQETCVQQMTELFECFKKNDFDQAVCGKEIAAFKACTDISMAQGKKIKEMRKNGNLSPGSETLTTPQTNILLRRYPQHNPNVPDRWSMKKYGAP
ncbi:hypothetical protein BV898_01384 [Hypsibius exemplaris]|uniref:CHCH domain-containing protein n=1 Tax=Hypsibius exemplaris TaxID=2072580 RepID=A0A1W0XBT7_HYPEX|nr:hypothetical protein BV898_01384 [Hypsibius exemplaris]